MSTETQEQTQTPVFSIYLESQARLRAFEETLTTQSAKKSSKAKGKAATGEVQEADRTDYLTELLFCRAVGNLESYLRRTANELLRRYPAIMKNDCLSFEMMMAHEDLSSLLNSMVASHVNNLFITGTDEFATMLSKQLKFQLFSSAEDQQKVTALLRRKRACESLGAERVSSEDSLLNDDEKSALKDLLDYCDRIVQDIDQRVAASLLPAN